MNCFRCTDPRHITLFGVTRATAGYIFDVVRTAEAVVGVGGAASWNRVASDARRGLRRIAARVSSVRQPEYPLIAVTDRRSKIAEARMRHHQRIPLIVLTLIVSALVFAVTVPTGPPALALAADRPNIIYIMSDDHAAHAIGAYGSKVNKTPHLDRLAREGALLTNVFATNSICTPSRAAILTGQYSHLNGVTVFNRFDSSRQTVAKLLQAGGYHTAHDWQVASGQRSAGFDHWEILPGQGAYFDPVLYTATGEKTYTGRYVTDVIDGSRHRVHPLASAREAVLPDAAPQGAAPAVGARSCARRAVRRAADSRAGDAVGYLRQRGRTRCARISSESRTT